MNERLEQEMQTIIRRYNVYMEQECLHSTYSHTPIKDIDEFEERMSWEWLWNNFHPSHDLICEFHHKLNMKLIFDSLTMTRGEFKYYMDKRKRENVIHSRCEILDIR